jgi:hypothetical protein
MALLTKGTVRRPGVHLQEIEVLALDGVLDVHETDHMQFGGDHLRLFFR